MEAKVRRELVHVSTVSAWVPRLDVRLPLFLRVDGGKHYRPRTTEATKYIIHILDVIIHFSTYFISSANFSRLRREIDDSDRRDMNV
jgi:hypothetical protein